MKAITPKRRRQLLDPENIKAWTGAFTRRSPGASAVPPDTLVDRYLADTRAEILRTDERLTGQLQASILDALGSLWSLNADGKSAVPDLLLLDPVRKGGKQVFTIPAGTVLNTGSGFSHKELCEAGTLTAGSACVFSCAYCSVGASMFQSPQTRILRLLMIPHDHAVIRRLDTVSILRDQLTHRDGTPKYLHEEGRRTVFTSPIVDPLPGTEYLEETLELILLILELTPWDVRILTKSMLVRKLAERIPARHRHRIIYGLSLGILDDAMASKVERLTSAPSKRLEAYHELQRRGLRTYSMHCPILPQPDYRAYAERLAANVNWDRDEHVWAEAMNRRGESFPKTIEALRQASYHSEAKLFEQVTRTQAAWEFGYNRPLFEALAEVCPPGKLRYLVYASGSDRDYWLARRDRGAVVLGKDKGEW